MSPQGSTPPGPQPRTADSPRHTLSFLLLQYHASRLTQRGSFATDVKALENEIQQASISKLMVLHPLPVSKNFPSVAQKLKQTNA